MAKGVARMSATSEESVSVTPALPRSLLFDRDYWLMRCEGFSVTVEGRPLGIVEELRFGSCLDRPDALVVRGRYLPRRRLFVLARDVEEIDPRRRVLLVRGASSLPRSRITWWEWLRRALARRR